MGSLFSKGQKWSQVHPDKECFEAGLAAACRGGEAGAACHVVSALLDAGLGLTSAAAAMAVRLLDPVASWEDITSVLRVWHHQICHAIFEQQSPEVSLEGRGWMATQNVETS